jgi:hypothetical protein
MPTTTADSSTSASHDPIPLRLPLARRADFVAYAKKEKRSHNAFARLLLLRGIAEYQQSPRSITSVVVEGPIDRGFIALRLPPDELTTVTAAAQTDARRVAEFARLMTLLGLALYEAENGITRS